MDKTELEEGLRHHHGSQEFTRHWVNGRLIMTEGTMFFAKHAGNGAFWFLDQIALFALPAARRQRQEFVHIKLIVADRKALITGDDGNGNIFWRKEIEFTDCPEGTWEFFLEGNLESGQPFTLMLPRER